MGSQEEVVTAAVSTAPITLLDRRASAIALLADRPSRAIVGVLGGAEERALTSAEIVRRARGAGSTRLLRDRLRALDRTGVVAPADPTVPAAAGGATWGLTDAGRDLHRLYGVIGRIALGAIGGGCGEAVALSAMARERTVDAVLGALCDPVVIQIGRCLATGPLEATPLEEACRPTARRTLYRRLDRLVRSGVVVRRTIRTVPRRTIYELAGRWRPGVAILLLSAWWEWRHGTPADPLQAADLEGLLRMIGPLVETPASRDGARLRWMVTSAGRPTGVALEVAAGGLRVAAANLDDDADPEVDVEVSGPAGAWAGALVTGESRGLTAHGDAQLAFDIGAALRAALLVYLRTPGETPAARL